MGSRSLAVEQRVSFLECPPFLRHVTFNRGRSHVFPGWGRKTQTMFVGCFMNLRNVLTVTLLLAAFSLTSCSGAKTSGGGSGGKASVSLSISDSAPANTAIMSFTLPVLGVTLTPSGGGSAVSVVSSTANFELTRLQSDSALVAANVSVAAASYTAVNVTVSAPSAVLFNGSGAAIGSCANAAVCALQGKAATITFSFPTGAPLVLTANQHQWLGLDFNYNNAIVSATGSITVDVTQPNVLTALTTPLTGVSNGDFANIDDFTGQVTAISSSSITLKSTVRGSLTDSITSTIPVNDPQSQCTGGGKPLSCIQMGSIVSLQGVLTNTGAVNGTELDIIDASTSPVDEAEGTFYANPGCASGFGMILSDSSITSSSPLVTAGFGANICLTLGTNATFTIDDGILTNQGVPTGGFSNLFAGQTVRAKISNAVSGSNVINATASGFILRFSRLTATVSSVTTPTFTITGLPAYFAATPTTTPSVQTYTNATLFEGVLSAGQTASLSALFLNPQTSQQPFQAAKVRVP